MARRVVDECLASKLMQLCKRTNLEKQEAIAAGTLRPYEPNLYAVCRLLIKRLTRTEQISYAELVNPEGRTITHFVSHYWSPPPPLATV